MTSENPEAQPTVQTIFGVIRFFPMIRIAWSPRYCHALPEGHRFPMEKYNLLPEQLLYEGSVTETQFFEPAIPSPEEIILTHSPAYFDSLLEGTVPPSVIRRIGFPFSPSLIEREIQIAGGTYECARFALQHGLSFNVAGGTHHAFYAEGEGFCILNDIAFAANLLLEQKLVNQILVVDLDVHQGNGTAALFRHNPKVFTFSMHGQNNFPLKKEASDLDIGLPDGTEDRPYLSLLALHLPRLIDHVRPELVFYQSGVDILETDRLGRLKLSRKACAERDEMVFRECKKAGVPVVVVMGGGYSRRIADVVEAHANTFRRGFDCFG